MLYFLSSLSCVSGGRKKKNQSCRNPGSNQGPLDLQSNALPTELFRLLALTFYSAPPGRTAGPGSSTWGSMPGVQDKQGPTPPGSQIPTPSFKLTASETTSPISPPGRTPSPLLLAVSLHIVFPCPFSVSPAKMTDP